MTLRYLFLIIGFLRICEAQLHHYEGERVKFSFCGRLIDTENCLIEIRKQYGKPFYRNGTFIQSSLQGDQKLRFIVDEGPQHYHIKYVVIHNISRNDGGTYICRAYRTVGEEKEECSRESISLTVKYPPGKANCTILQDTDSDIEISGRWQWVKCVASEGSIPGVLRCYQNGRIAPYLQRQEERYSSNIVKTMWIERGVPTRCCSHDVSERTTEANCTDFTLNLKNNEERVQVDIITSISPPTSTRSEHTRSLNQRSTEKHLETPDDIHLDRDVRLEWSGPLVSIVVVLTTIPVVILMVCAFWSFRKYEKPITMEANLYQDPQRLGNDATNNNG